MLELEKQLENPYDESRVRYLDGKDLQPAQMHEKIEDVSRLIMDFKYYYTKITSFSFMETWGSCFPSI